MRYWQDGGCLLTAAALLIIVMDLCLRSTQPLAIEPQVRLLKASRSVVRALLSWLVPEKMWMTYRLPFQRVTTITYPPWVFNPRAAMYAGVMVHEHWHARNQWSRWWGPYLMPLLAALLPLPLLFSGRWFIERGAYLEDIRHGRESVNSAVEKLWRGYLFPWPRPLMRRWFERQLNNHHSNVDHYFSW